MAIDMWVRREGPEGQDLEQGSVPWKVLPEVLNPRDTPLLIGVNPYGDTVFNEVQVERQLPREVAYLRSHLTDSRGIGMLDELERLIALATRDGPYYLWFVVD